MLRTVLYALFAVLLTACVSAPEFPNEPVITFERLSSSEIHQFTTGPVDSIVIQFSFTDGDGDLSSLPGDGVDSVDIFLTDSRLLQPRPLTIPYINPEGTGNGISGDVFFTLVNTTGICCIFDRRLCASDPSFPVDTFSYEIQIRDRAGNFSNKIRTPVIDILCLGQ